MPRTTKRITIFGGAVILSGWGNQSISDSRQLPHRGLRHPSAKDGNL